MLAPVLNGTFNAIMALSEIGEKLGVSLFIYFVIALIKLHKTVKKLGLGFMVAITGKYCN